MFFAATTAVLVMVWLAWLTVYVVGGHAWRDAAVGAGVTASATAVLLGVFIPRTYLMAGAMVRDKLAAQLPALARDASITDLAFRGLGGVGAGVGPALGTGTTATALYDSVSLSGCGVGGGGAGGGAGSIGSRRPAAGVPLGVPRAASPNVYSDRHTSRTRPATPLTPENTYARYEVPSPHKVTRF